MNPNPKRVTFLLPFVPPFSSFIFRQTNVSSIPSYILALTLFRSHLCIFEPSLFQIFLLCSACASEAVLSHVFRLLPFSFVPFPLFGGIFGVILFSFQMPSLKVLFSKECQCMAAFFGLLPSLVSCTVFPSFFLLPFYGIAMNNIGCRVI